jgi:hypothetical protein
VVDATVAQHRTYEAYLDRVLHEQYKVRLYTTQGLDKLLEIQCSQLLPGKLIRLSNVQCKSPRLH